MILTKCAACAISIPHTAPRCGVCKTRYCGRDCQKLAWKGGHKALCPQIKSGGGAEQYNANKKYAEAVAVAVKKCAADTKGQTCYICTEALHWKTKEGLVRGCACRGTAGCAHVSCLVEQAKILVAEAEENNLEQQPRWERWRRCGLCEQEYHGVVRCALGWACWKTYVGRPETDGARKMAMNVLGLGLSDANQHADALTVGEAALAMMQRLGASESDIIVAQSNLSSTYRSLGRHESALHMKRDVYSGCLKLNGEEHEYTLIAANNYANSLIELKRFKEAKPLLRKMIPVARRVHGEDYRITLKLRRSYARALYQDPDATLDDLREAVTTLEDTSRTARRVLGGAHPLTAGIEDTLRDARLALGGARTPPPRA